MKLDEDLPHGLVEFLVGRGFNAVNVRMQGWTGKPDVHLFAAIQGEKRWLFTADKGFSDIRRYVPGSHHGIVLFRPDHESRESYLRLAAALVDKVDLAEARGALIVVTDRAIRIVRTAAP